MTEQNTNDSLVSDEKMDNIFKELSGDLDFGNTEQDEIIEIKKGKIYYLTKASVFLGWMNVIIIIGGLFLFLYIKVQQNEDLLNKSYLTPFCGILTPKDVNIFFDDCSSVAALNKDYEYKTQELQKNISSQVSKILIDLYSIENFTSSKEVTFLMQSKENRIRVLDMLNDFDNLKNDFSRGDKKMITCDKISMNNKFEMDITCDAYSSSWEKSDGVGGGILGPSASKSGNFTEGTSISIAASFLNFIEKNKLYNVKLLEKPKVFETQPVVGDGPYVKKTKIRFQLKYNNLNSLSL